ncbi:MAG: hypothetical protein ACO3FI_08595 [Cyclobacteriaceae bacterium]
MNKKYYRSIYILLISLIMWSCGNENDPSPSSAELILGSWNYSTIDVTLKAGNQSFVNYLISQGFSAEEAELLSSEFASVFEDLDVKIDFKKGGTYSRTAEGSTESATWELSSDGKTLTLNKGTTDETVWKVTKLTDKNLNLSTELTDDSLGDPLLTISLDLGLTR